jgi:hypothetical protein
MKDMKGRTPNKTPFAAPSRKAKIIHSRPADENNVVHTIQGGRGDYCQTPCPECPWRKEKAGSFPAEAFRISALTSYDMATHTFACHMRGSKNPAVCAGFLLRGADDNLAIRIQRAQGRMRDVSANGATLHKSYRAMAVANGVSPQDPCLKDCMPEGRFRNGR